MSWFGSLTQSKSRRLVRSNTLPQPQQEQSSTELVPNSPSRKETNKTGLIQARGDDDAHARAERELLEFKDFAGSQMIALDGELTDDANTNALHWWKKWGSKFPDLSQCPEAMLTASAPVERPTSRTGLEADTMLKPLDQEQENDLDDVMCDYGLVRYDSYNT